MIESCTDNPKKRTEYSYLWLVSTEWTTLWLVRTEWASLWLVWDKAERQPVIYRLPIVTFQPTSWHLLERSSMLYFNHAPDGSSLTMTISMIVLIKDALKLYC